MRRWSAFLLLALALFFSSCATKDSDHRILVSVAIWVGHRISPRSQHIFELEGLLTDGVLLLMGVPLAHLALVAPWAAGAPLPCGESTAKQ